MVYDVPKTSTGDECHPVKDNKYVAKLRMFRVENGNAEKQPRYCKQKLKSSNEAAESTCQHEEDESDGSDFGSSDEFVDCLDGEDDEDEDDEDDGVSTATTTVIDAATVDTATVESSAETRNARKGFESKIKTLVSLTKSVRYTITAASLLTCAIRYQILSICYAV